MLINGELVIEEPDPDGYYASRGLLLDNIPEEAEL